MDMAKTPVSPPSPSRVVLIRCESYDKRKVQSSITMGFELLGGIQNFIRPTEKILLKPNLLAGKTPEKAVTTHPVVFETVADLLSCTGAKLTYGDSPGFGKLSTVARRAGLETVANNLGITLADFQTGTTVSFPEGYVCKQFTIARGALEADGIISLPKLKTHALTRLTGAIKNQFGCVPGFLKGEFHGRLTKMETFAAMLVDLTRFLKPRLYIMDGILAMEGNGPGSGDPRELGVLLMSTDPVALDAMACHIINLDPLLVPTIKVGKELGLGDYESVELLGDSLESCRCKDFNANRKPEVITDSIHWLAAPLMRRYLIPRPVIRPEHCTRCGSCVQMCPAIPKAINFRKPDRNEPPEYDYNLCIRCYCCQEICPEKAIEVETPWLGHLLHS